MSLSRMLRYMTGSWVLALPVKSYNILSSPVGWADLDNVDIALDPKRLL